MNNLHEQTFKTLLYKALLSIFNVNRGEIGKMYTEIGQNTQTLHRPGFQDQALFQVRVTASTDRMSKCYKGTHTL